MLTGTCHCGAIAICIPAAPAEITSCNCSICRRLGTFWAYYEADTVVIDGHPEGTENYIQGDKTLRVVRCKTCGCTSHWETLDAKTKSRVGINMRNFEPEIIDGVRMRLLDGANTWTSTFKAPET